MPELILAIDQGTTGTTVFVVDAAGRIRGRAYAEIRQYYPKPGWVEHDPEEIYRSAVALVEKSDRRDEGACHRDRRNRHHQSARDLRAMGAQQRPPDPSRDRMAMPAQRVDLRRLARARARSRAPHGPARRSLLLGHQAQMAARRKSRNPKARRARRAVLRHDRHLAGVQTVARRRVRDRLHQRVANDDVQSGAPGLGRRDARDAGGCA